MNILVSGWFSFKDMGTTAGDIIACDLVCEWLQKSDISFQVASKHDGIEGIHWENADPEKYTHVIFVCGPFGNGWPLTTFLEHFRNSKLIGLNLSMLQELQEWNPFDFLIERDSEFVHNPDLTFAVELQKVPVVGVIKAHKQKEYKEKAWHDVADKAIDDLIAIREMAVIHIDTSIENNQYGLRTYREIESLIAQTDVIITTRLHGLVLALKNGVPALAIDPILGGAKITSQANAINWPYCLKVDEISLQMVCNTFDACLSTEALNSAKQSARKGREMVMKFEKRVKEYFLTQH